MPEGDDELGGHSGEVANQVYFGVSGFRNGFKFMMCRPSEPYMCDHVTPLWDGVC